MCERPWERYMAERHPDEEEEDPTKLEGRTLELFEESFKRHEEALRRLAEL